MAIFGARIGSEFRRTPQRTKWSRAASMQDSPSKRRALAFLPHENNSMQELEKKMSAIAKTSARLSRILSPLLLGILLAACGANVQSTPPPPVAPTPPGAPTLTLSAQSTSVETGAATTLTWSSTDASACSAGGAWSGAKSTSGTESTGALSATSAFSLDCSGSGGTTSQSVTVTVSAVAAAPTVSLTADPISVVPGDSATLNWSTTNASSCTASGGWMGSKATSGSASTGALNATSTFSLACTGTGRYDLSKRHGDGVGSDCCADGVADPPIRPPSSPVIRRRSTGARQTPVRAPPQAVGWEAKRLRAARQQAR